MKLSLFIVLLITNTSAMAEEPAGFTHSQTDNGHHRYVINDIYTGSYSERLNTAQIESGYASVIENCTTVKVDVATATMTILTTRPLTNLIETIDMLAGFGGGMLYWSELVERGKRSVHYGTVEYRLIPDSSNTLVSHVAPRSLAWLNVDELPTTNLFVRYSQSERGEITIGPHTAHCMAHHRYAMRLWNSAGDFVWENLNDLFASCSIVINDLDGDDIDEIIVHRNDHNVTDDYLVFKLSPRGDGQASQQAVGANGEPAAASR
jgi:hypothetical protein